MSTLPILLTLDAVVLLVLGAGGAVVPVRFRAATASLLSGAGVVACLVALLARLAPMHLALPVGPMGLVAQVALDPLSALFLLAIFTCGLGVTGFQAAAGDATALDDHRTAAIFLGGAVIAVLAADGVVLAIGLFLTCLAARRPAVVPLLVLAAVLLMTPPGATPGTSPGGTAAGMTGGTAAFDAIRATAVAPGAVAVAIALIAAAAGLIALPKPTGRSWTADALAAGCAGPLALYLLTRTAGDLAITQAQWWWGYPLILAGSVVAAVHGWQAAAALDIDVAANASARRQVGLGAIAAGSLLVARAADMPIPASTATSAICLIAIGGAIAGTLTALAAHVIAAGAGTFRLSRMGGLVGLMPVSSAALGVGLLGLSALPTGVGFAALWELLQSLIATPHGDGLLAPVALTVAIAAIAAAAGLATVTGLRVFGIAALGRPRTPRGSGAQETTRTVRNALLAMGGLTALLGLIPGWFLWLLGTPAIRAVSGLPPRQPLGMALLPLMRHGYWPLPLGVFVAAIAAGLVLSVRLNRKEIKPTGVWADGMRLPYSLPFGEPNAQSAGEGFLPELPTLTLPRPPTLPAWRWTTSTGLWCLLAGIAVAIFVAGGR